MPAQSPHPAGRNLEHLLRRQYDYGYAVFFNINNPHFDARQLQKMKRECQPRCFSTLNHNLAFCYNDGRAVRWILKQAARAFQGVTGSFT